MQYEEWLEQEKNLITFNQKASIARPLSDDQRQKISEGKKDTQDLLTTSSQMNEQAQEIQEVAKAIIVDPRVELNLVKAQETVTQITPANINRSIDDLTTTITETNRALKTSVQKVVNAQQIFIKLGYTGKLDDLTAMNRFFRIKSIDLHPDKQAGKPDDEKEKVEEQFKELSRARDILQDTQAIQALQSAIKGQQQLMIEFKEKVENENITLSPEEKAKITDLEQKPITAEELRMLDMERRFEETAKENYATRKQFSEKLLMNFQINAEKIKNTVLEPSLAKLPDIINTGWLSSRNISRRLYSTTAEQEIKSEIIDPYLQAIKELYKPEVIQEMLPDDQRALKRSYQKAMNAYKDELLKYFLRYKKENISNSKLSQTIDEIANKLDLTEKQVSGSSYFEWPTLSNAAATPSRSPYGSAAQQLNNL